VAAPKEVEISVVSQYLKLLSNLLSYVTIVWIYFAQLLFEAIDVVQFEFRSPN